VPDEILGQLGNRIQHALRAFTPRDQKAVRAAAETFAPNPQLDVAAAISQLAVGEALVSTLREGGVPSPVERVLVSTPRCRIGTIGEAERAAVRERSPVGAKYDTPLNRDSAAEMLARRAGARSVDTAPPAAPGAPHNSDWSDTVHGALFGTGRRQGMIETMGKQMVRTMGSQLGRQIMRGVLGGIFGGRR
jgi:uncharacterized protein